MRAGGHDREHKCVWGRCWRTGQRLRGLRGETRLLPGETRRGCAPGVPPGREVCQIALLHVWMERCAAGSYARVAPSAGRAAAGSRGCRRRRRARSTSPRPTRPSRRPRGRAGPAPVSGARGLSPPSGRGYPAPAGCCGRTSNASSPSGGSGPVTRVEACMAYEVAHGVEVRLPVPSKGRGPYFSTNKVWTRG